MPPLRARIVCTLSIAFCLVALSACASGGALEGKTAAPDASEERAGEGRTGGAERPNIVLIMADDLGYGNIEPYGQRHIQTPHLERMARQGTRFAEFYAGSTVCAPSRSVLMTGLHTGHTPIRGNRPVYPIGQEPLPPETVTMAEMLSGAGYRTGLFGKWGLGGPESESTPGGQGFDEFFGYIDQRRAHFYWPEFLFASSEGEALRRVPLPGNEVNDDPERHPGAGPATRRGTYGPAAIRERALAFIEESAETGRPFFADLPSVLPTCPRSFRIGSLKCRRERAIRT
jgi:arylsulfatase A-like enzyme